MGMRNRGGEEAFIGMERQNRAHQAWEGAILLEQAFAIS